jgi:Cysteine-rich CPXCG
MSTERGWRSRNPRAGRVVCLLTSARTGEMCGVYISRNSDAEASSPLIDFFDDLDDEFPLGDGTADTAGSVICPYCGEHNLIALDPGSGDRQDYVEDCQVCCQPWRVRVYYDAQGSASVRVDREVA